MPVGVVANIGALLHSTNVFYAHHRARAVLFLVFSS